MPLRKKRIHITEDFCSGCFSCLLDPVTTLTKDLKNIISRIQTKSLQSRRFHRTQTGKLLYIFPTNPSSQTCLVARRVHPLSLYVGKMNVLFPSVGSRWNPFSALSHKAGSAGFPQIWFWRKCTLLLKTHSSSSLIWSSSHLPFRLMLAFCFHLFSTLGYKNLSPSLVLHRARGFATVCCCQTGGSQETQRRWAVCLIPYQTDIAWGSAMCWASCPH